MQSVDIMDLPSSPGHDQNQNFQNNSQTYQESIHRLFAKISLIEPHVQAWEWLDKDHALQKAKILDSNPGHYRTQPLIGIPFGIKDIIDTAGMPTRMGSPIYTTNRPNQSALVVKKIESAGAIVLGKTVTTEFAYQCPGKTRNPWNPDHTPGGSSSGSAAAVAAGMVPLALGTQTMGSIIRPAAFCGVVGFKPSYGAISLHGIHPFSPTLDHVGIFAHCVSDIWQVAMVLMGDPIPEDLSFSDSIFSKRASLHLGVFKSPWWESAEIVQQDHFLACVDKLETAGVSTKLLSNCSIVDKGPDTVDIIMAYESARIFRPLVEAFPDQLSQHLTNLISKGLSISLKSYQLALSQQQEIKFKWAEMIHQCDAVLTPSTTGPAPKGLNFTGDAIFCKTWTLCGVPSINLPTGCSHNGLPLGTQFLCHYRQDRRLLAIARWCEQIFAFE